MVVAGRKTMTTVFIEVFWGELAAYFCYRSVLGLLTWVFMSQGWRIQGLVPLIISQTKTFFTKVWTKTCFFFHTLLLPAFKTLVVISLICFSCCRLKLFWCATLSRTLALFWFLNHLLQWPLFYLSFILFSSFILVGEITLNFFSFNMKHTHTCRAHMLQQHPPDTTSTHLSSYRFLQ